MCGSEWQLTPYNSQELPMWAHLSNLKQNTCKATPNKVISFGLLKKIVNNKEVYYSLDTPPAFKLHFWMNEKRGTQISSGIRKKHE